MGYFRNSSKCSRFTLSCGFVLLLILLLRWSRYQEPFLFNINLPEWNGLPSPATEQTEIAPRLNTSWHRRIALEMMNDRTNLTAVKTQHGTFDRTRVALLMENRPLPYLVPLLIHFMAVVPSEWSFRFMGSEESLALLESNPMIRRYMTQEKLFIDLIPYDVVENINSYKKVNHLLTRPWLYEEWLWPAKWLFLFQDDSMICSASKLTLNDFVDEDWSFIGGSAYSNSVPNGMNGGFSLRKVPHLISMLHTLSFEEFAAAGNVATEDHYFTTSMWNLPEAKMPIGHKAIRFGVVIHYHPDPTEMPLGFHAHSSDGIFRGPEGQANQDKAYAYCPELAIISVGRWDCQCSPNRQRPGGLGG